MSALSRGLTSSFAGVQAIACMRTTDRRSQALLPHSRTLTGVLATVRRFSRTRVRIMVCLRLFAAFPHSSTLTGLHAVLCD